MKSVVAWTLILNVAISVLITVATLLFAKPVLRLIQTPEDVFSESRTYLTVVMAGMATALFYNMGSGLLRAVGNSKIPLYFLIFSCSLNLLLDLLAVTVFSFGGRNRRSDRSGPADLQCALLFVSLPEFPFSDSFQKTFFL